MSALRDAIVASVFPDGAPPSLSALLAPPLDPLAFGVGAILPVGRAARARIYVAHVHDPQGWRAAVEAALPGQAVRAFLDGAPAGVRRMVDTDGVRADLYLDDLQLHGREEMCEILSWPGGQRSSVRFVDAPPEPFAAWRALCGAGGRLALRSGPGQPDRLLWITEARWRGTLAETEALALRLVGLPEAYRALARTVAGLGRAVYVDALDIGAGGDIDLTVGVQ